MMRGDTECPRCGSMRLKRWDDLSELDRQRQQLMAHAVKVERVSTRPADIAACVEAIQSILECDEQTRTLAKAWQSAMSETLGIEDDSRMQAHA